MPSLEQWGPATWALFHCFAGRMRVESFPIVGKQLLFLFVQIASCLPCPECTGHAKKFFASFSLSTITSVEQLQNMLFHFHNRVNLRKGKAAFAFSSLSRYSSSHSSSHSSFNLLSVYNIFVRFFHTKGDLTVLAESFHRSKVLAQFRHFLRLNLAKHFVIAVYYNPTSPFSLSYPASGSYGYNKQTQTQTEKNIPLYKCADLPKKERPRTKEQPEKEKEALEKPARIRAASYPPF